MANSTELGVFLEKKGEEFDGINADILLEMSSGKKYEPQEILAKVPNPMSLDYPVPDGAQHYKTWKAISSAYEAGDMAPLKEYCLNQARQSLEIASFDDSLRDRYLTEALMYIDMAASL